MPLNIRIQWNAGTACVSECVLKTLACRVCVSALLSWKTADFCRLAVMPLGQPPWAQTYLEATVPWKHIVLLFLQLFMGLGPIFVLFDEGSRNQYFPFFSISGRRPEMGLYQAVKTARQFFLFLIQEIESPRCGSGPKHRLEGPTSSSPNATGGPFPPATALPSPPSPSLFPPPPLALFAMLRERAARAGVGGGVLGHRGEEPDIHQMFDVESITDPTYPRRASPVTDAPVFGDHPSPPEEFGIIKRGVAGTASLRSRTGVKRNAAFGAFFKRLSLYFLYQKGNLIRIKTGLDTYLRKVSKPVPPCHSTPPLWSAWEESYPTRPLQAALGMWGHSKRCWEVGRCLLGPSARSEGLLVKLWLRPGVDGSGEKPDHDGRMSVRDFMLGSFRQVQCAEATYQGAVSPNGLMGRFPSSAKIPAIFQCQIRRQKQRNKSQERVFWGAGKGRD